MPQVSIRRALAISTAVVALGGTFLVGGAEAATAKPVIDLAAPAAIALPSSAAQPAQTSLQWSTKANHLGWVNDTVTIDARGLASVAKVTFGGTCSVHGLVAVCQDALYFDSTSATATTGGTAGLTLSALPGAKLGATGSYKVSASSTQATLVGGTGEVIVGGPEYQLGTLAAHTNLKVGSTVSEPVVFGNAGDRPAVGSKVALVLSPGLTFATRYSNCEYRSHLVAGHPSDDAALCSFGGVLRVDAKVELAQPVKLAVGSQALYSYLDVQAAPGADASTFSWLTTPVTGETWRKGSGAALGLTTLAAGQAGSAPAGTVQLPSEDQGYGIADIYADNTADFGVTGSSAKAAKGKTVAMSFTMDNHGPATLYDRSGGDDTPYVVVTPPPGTTVVGSSSTCYPETSNDPTETAHGPYTCGPDTVGLVPVGSVYHFSLTLRVDTVVNNAKGSVKLGWGINGTGVPPFDPTLYDNPAVLLLN
ncbi:hypothetical protein [Streptacidiphilus sp. P02-A3a]|uniref:hypothetical protein n=1 Tax=Streptacidiphilus sp. P02-A3a TaxID=2704468 RepID=UPI0015FDF1BE|nr:hypothetical protein [Streptacidiphilus sp. P02-A3a]QMU67154.1 hypothetical protein GXP74_01945 [Streptacidiphilus sp. P02-A3a]